MTNEELIYNIRHNIDPDYNLDVLCQNNKGLVYSVAYIFSGLERLDDLTQEGYTALIKAVYSYDLESDTSFFSYAYTCIRRNLAKYISNCGSLVRVPSYKKTRIETISLDSPSDEYDYTLLESIPDKRDPFEDILTAYQIAQITPDLWKMIHSLSDPEREIIIEYYFNDHTDNEISELMHIPPYKVSRIRKKALMHLRMNDSGTLGSFVCDYYSEGIRNVGMRSFRRNFTSTTEYYALRHLEQEHRLRKKLGHIGENML